MGNRRKTAGNSRVPSISTEHRQVRAHLPIPRITLDTFAAPVIYYAFLNIYTMPLVMFIIAPMLSLIMYPVLALGICWGIGASCILLYYLRFQHLRRVDWKNEIVVITGGSHGLGKELATQLASQCEPRKIIVLDITATVHESPLVAYYECDISDRRKIKSVAESIIQDYGHPTILINNAGIVRGRSFMELSEAEIEKTISINLLGQIWTCKAFLPHMVEKNRGHIVNISSLMGLTGARNMTDYCASKFGSVGFSESLRQDLSDTHVQVSTVYPGLIDTGMFFGVDHRFPIITPPLHPKNVSKEIISILDSGRGQDIKLPFYGNLVGILRLLPREFSDWVREFTGANNDMKKFQYSLSTPKTE